MSQPVPILMYHAVGHRPAEATHGLSVSPDAFAEQMELLGERGFTPAHHRAAGRRLAVGRRRPLPRRPVLITFDDGYEGVHRHALPVLAEHGFASTLFVSTGWLRGAVRRRRRARHHARLGPGARTGRRRHGDRRAHPHPSAARPARRRPAAGTRRVRCRDIIADELGARAGLLRLSVRLLQPPGAAYGPGGGFRAVARRGQRPRRAAGRGRTPCSG